MTPFSIAYIWQMQHPNGELTERARNWASGIYPQFITTPPKD
jgi:hypothetical protein